ncbi:MAG: hypothetical protein ACRD1T_00715 [Acidimicrobiia bacterium]
MKVVASLLLLTLLLNGCTSGEETAQPVCESVQQAETKILSEYESRTAQGTPEPLPTDDLFAELERRQRALDEQRADREAYSDAIRELAVLTEQNPDCFTPEERAKIEARYRELKGE